MFKSLGPAHGPSKHVSEPPNDGPSRDRARESDTNLHRAGGREEKGGIGAPRVQSTQLLEPVHTGIIGREWSVCSGLLHRVVLTDGPLLRADASDLSTGDSSLTGGVIVSQPPQAVTLYPQTLRDLSARSMTYDMNLQLRKLSIVFFANRSVGRSQLANNSTRQCIRSSTCTWPQEPWVNVVSPSSTSQHLCASDRDACKRAGPQPKKIESATIALLSAREITVKNIDVEHGGALVDLHQAQLRPRPLHVCVATRRRAVWTRGAVSTAS